LFSDASGIDFRAMLKKKQHAKQNEEPEPDSAELKPIEEPVVELKKAEKVGAGVEDRLFPTCIEINPLFKKLLACKRIWKYMGGQFQNKYIFCIQKDLILFFNECISIFICNPIRAFSLHFHHFAILQTRMRI